MTADVKKVNAFSRFLKGPWAPIALMAVLVIILFGQFLFSDKMLFSSDQISGFDAKTYAKASLEKDHQFPFWFNSRLSGTPTIDALFGDALYLPSVALNTLFSVPRAIGMKMVFHIFLAGLFFFLMLRKGFKFTPLVATAGAIFYMLNPQFVSHIYPGHDGKMYVIAWLPFIIWQLKALMDRPGVLNMSLAGFGVGMSILTSHIQMTYFVLWGMFLYWVISLYITLFIQKDRIKAIRQAFFFWAAILIGLGLGAVQLLPSFLFIRDGFSVRGADRGFEFAASWALGWPEFFSLLVPDFVNTLDYYWGTNPFKLNSEYAGMMPLLLAVLAIVAKPKKTWRIFWGGVAVFAALFALGAHTPVFHIAYAIIPGVRKFRAASMIMFWFSFSTILLSALFLKDLASGYFKTFSEVRRSTWAKGLLIACGACLGIAVIFSFQGFVKGLFSGVIADQGKDRIFDVNFSRNFLPFLWMWFIFTGAALLLLRTTIAGKMPPWVFIAAALVLGIVDAMRVDALFVKLIDPAPHFKCDGALRPLMDEMKREPFRCFTLPGALAQNGEGIQGLEGVGGFHDNELHWYREFRGDQQDRNFLSSLIEVNPDGSAYLRGDKLPEGNPFLNLANAKYLLVRNGAQLLTIANRNALGRLSFVGDYAVMDSGSIIEALGAGTYDYKRKVALTVKPQLPTPFALQPDAATTSNTLETKWQNYTPNYRKAMVNAPSDGFLRIAEVYYPGWEIRIDGKKTAYYRADLAWMAVPLMRGNHTVEMIPHSNYFGKFAPVSFGVAGCLLLFWGVYGAAVFLRRKKVVAA